MSLFMADAASDCISCVLNTPLRFCALQPMRAGHMLCIGWGVRSPTYCLFACCCVTVLLPTRSVGFSFSLGSLVFWGSTVCVFMEPAAYTRRRIYRYVGISGHGHCGISSAPLWLSPVSRSFAHLNYMQPDLFFIRPMLRDLTVADTISGFLIFFLIFGIFGMYRARIYGGCCLQATAKL